MFPGLKPFIFAICLLVLWAGPAPAANWPVYKTAGFSAFDDGDYLGAVEQFEVAFIVAKEERAAPQDLGAILENLATVYYAVGRHYDAWASVEQWDKLMLGAEEAPWVPQQKAVRDPLARMISQALAKVRTSQPAADGLDVPDAPGDYAIHLESAALEENVQPSWDNLLASYPAQLTDKSLLVRQVDLDELGVFYRILAAPYGDSAEAGRVCEALAADGQYCMVYSLE